MKSVFVLLALILLAGGFYVNSIPGAFHYDDFPLMLESAAVTGESFPYGYFLQNYGGRPFTLWSFHINRELFGELPLGFHLVNLSLHLLASALLYVLTLRVTGHWAAAFFSAVLFSVHPLQTQAVNYVWARSVLLMTCFGLLTLLCWHRHPVLALLTFQLAIWSRAEAVILLIPLLLIRRDWWRWPSLLAGVNLLVVLYSIVQASPAQLAWNHSGVLEHWRTAPLAFWTYLKLVVLPAGLSIDHDLVPPGWGPALILGLGAGAAFLAALWLALRQPEIGLPLSAGFLFLLPGLLVPNAELLSEPRAYASLAAFCVAGGAGWARWGFVIKRGQLVSLACCIIVAVFGMATVERNRLWADDTGLWREAAARYPVNPLARYNLGVALTRQGDLSVAEEEFRVASSLNPADDLSYAALGYCAEYRGDAALALAYYEMALRLNPTNSYAARGRARLQAMGSTL